MEKTTASARYLKWDGNVVGVIDGDNSVSFVQSAPSNIVKMEMVRELSGNMFLGEILGI